MENQILEKRVNVAPQSTTGHYVEKARKVVDLDNINETFYVEGKSQMTTKNHTTLKLNSDVLVTCQTVYDPFGKMYQRSRD